MDLESVLMFEVSALSWQHISISLEHPLDESMATVELQLSEPSAPRATVYALNAPPRDHVDDYISRVLHNSHSIPVTLRYSSIKLIRSDLKSSRVLSLACGSGHENLGLV